MTAAPGLTCLRVWAATDIGKVRRENEDCVGAGDAVLQSSTGRFDIELSLSETTGTVVVADGVGGGRGGRVAAGLAVSAFLGRCTEVADLEALAAVIDGVSESVRLACAQDNATRGGATTLSGIVFSRAFAFAFNVGDSRVYRIRPEGLDLVSQDHVSSFDARMLTKFLGGSGVMAVPHCQEICLRQGDRYLVCSDGLYGVVTEDRLARLARLPDGRMAVDFLVAAALEAGAPDNITVALCEPA